MPFYLESFNLKKYVLGFKFGPLFWILPFKSNALAPGASALRTIG